MHVRWDIRREGRSWTAAEFKDRLALRPEKLEVWEGKLLLSHEERLSLLGLLLENVGADEAVKLGDPNVWIGAALSRPRSVLSDPWEREMLGIALLTMIIAIGLIWLLKVAPVPSAARATLLCSAALGIWVSAAVNFVLRD